MPLFFDSFPTRDYARRFVAMVKRRYGLDGELNYNERNDAGEPIEDWVTIDRPVLRNGALDSKIELEIGRLAKDYGGVFTGT